MQIVDEVKLFFEDNDLDLECRTFMEENDTSLVIDTFRDEICNISDWNVNNIVMAINNVKEKTGIKGKMLFMPIRIKVSGKMHGPELGDTIYLLGKDVILNRLDRK